MLSVLAIAASLSAGPASSAGLLKHRLRCSIAQLLRSCPLVSHQFCAPQHFYFIVVLCQFPGTTDDQEIPLAPPPSHTHTHTHTPLSHHKVIVHKVIRPSWKVCPYALISLLSIWKVLGGQVKVTTVVENTVLVRESFSTYTYGDDGSYWYVLSWLVVDSWHNELWLIPCHLLFQRMH